MTERKSRGMSFTNSRSRVGHEFVGEVGAFDLDVEIGFDALLHEDADRRTAADDDDPVPILLDEGPEMIEGRPDPTMKAIDLSKVRGSSRTQSGKWRSMFWAECSRDSTSSSKKPQPAYN